MSAQLENVSLGVPSGLTDNPAPTEPQRVDVPLAEVPRPEALRTEMLTETRTDLSRLETRPHVVPSEAARIGAARNDDALHQPAHSDFDELTQTPQMARATSRERTWLRIACGLLVVAALVIAYLIGTRTSTPAVTASATSSAAGAPVVAGAGSDRAALTVTLTAPKRVAWAKNLKATGSISAWQDAMVGAEVSGLRVAQVLVDVGDQVRRGQLLARFDDSTMQAAMQQQRAALVEAQANSAEADANARRAAQLRESGALSEQNIIQYETRARAVKAQVESAQARLRSSELALQFTRVTAPDDGVISMRSAMLGQVASPGAELFRLVRQNRIEWRAEVPAAQLALIRVGQVAQIHLQDGSTVNGAVRQVAPVLSENTRVGIAYVELDRAQLGNARPGMYASGTITLGEQPALTLPSSAIVQRDGHEYVFSVGADRHVLQHQIVTGRRVGTDVEVQSGMSNDLKVVQSGGSFLNEGDVVRVSEPGTN